jgi:hypothetical protein
MMEVLGCSETLVLSRTTRHNIPEDAILHSHRREDLKSCILCVSSRILNKWKTHNKLNSIELSTARVATGCGTYSIDFQHFMQPGSSLPHSQGHFTCPCPETDQSSPHHHILFPNFYFYFYFLMLSTHLRFRLPNGLFPYGFSTNNLYTFLFPPFARHDPLTSFSST